jgi:hypothetical protein
MNIESVGCTLVNERLIVGRPDSRSVFSDVLSYLPSDLLTGITILLQDTGYVTIKPIKMARSDWYRLDRSVKKMGGTWIREAGFSHWSIPLTLPRKQDLIH